MNQMHINLDDNPSPADLDAVHDGLREFNRSQLGYEDGRRVAIFVRDDQGVIIGGLLGYSYWDWLAIDILWLDESIRNQGYGSRLLAAAEAEAKARGCRQALLDTMSFQAPDFYRRHGYELFASLDGFPGKHQRLYFKKQLT